MGITDEVRKILQIKIKPRQDSYFDQFSRIFLLKVMFVGALFTGMNWYGDKITCIAPNGPDSGFISSACWINGFYVYEEIRYHENDVGYFGLPRDIRMDGVYPNGELCATSTPLSNNKMLENPSCRAMKKTYFLQYQYFTFLLLFIGCLYYIPYGFFKFVNTDMKSLKDSVKNGKADEIVESYFNRDLNSNKNMNYRVFGNVVVRLMYVVVNVCAFLVTDSTLMGGFASYGQQWIKWTSLDNAIAYDYMGLRLSPKPGDALLPSFAFCEVFEAAKDIKHTLVNKHRLVCELSQHILYQYILILVWFAMIAGIVISVIGLIKIFVDYALANSSLRGETITIRHSLNLREREYLSYIQRKNLPLFGDVVRKLNVQTKDAKIKDEVSKA